MRGAAASRLQRREHRGRTAWARATAAQAGSGRLYPGRRPLRRRSGQQIARRPVPCHRRPGPGQEPESRAGPPRRCPRAEVRCHVGNRPGPEYRRGRRCSVRPGARDSGRMVTVPPSRQEGRPSPRHRQDLRQARHHRRPARSCPVNRPKARLRSEPSRLSRCCRLAPCRPAPSRLAPCRPAPCRLAPCRPAPIPRLRFRLAPIPRLQFRPTCPPDPVHFLSSSHRECPIPAGPSPVRGQRCPVHLPSRQWCPTRMGPRVVLGPIRPEAVANRLRTRSRLIIPRTPAHHPKPTRRKTPTPPDPTSAPSRRPPGCSRSPPRAEAAGRTIRRAAGRDLTRFAPPQSGRPPCTRHRPCLRRGGPRRGASAPTGRPGRWGWRGPSSTVGNGERCRRRGSPAPSRHR